MNRERYKPAKAEGFHLTESAKHKLADDERIRQQSESYKQAQRATLERAIGRFFLTLILGDR